MVDDDEVVRDRKFLVFESSLLQLLKRCTRCGHDVQCKTSTRGTLLVVDGSCPDGHEFHWESQPSVRGMAAGNLLVSAATLFCGLTYTRMANMAKVLNVPFLCERYFYRLQNEYIFPVIHTAYVKHQEAIFAFLKGTPLQLSGDGRCNSPGYSAKYCTYSLMDNATDLIIDYSLVQMTETGSSVAMEKEGLDRSLSNVLANDIQVQSITTDRHTSATALLKKKYPDVVHYYDVWHLAKSVTKKLTKAAKRKDCTQLLPWIHSISNHLLWSAQTCDHNTELLCAKWTSIVHHISNIHQWDDGYEHFNHCAHETLSSDDERKKQWLEKNSPAHNALCKIIYNKTLQRDIKKLCGFQHTGSLEVFHSMLTKYCPKRQHFCYNGMRARTELAIIDHNNNTEREQASTCKGPVVPI